MKKLTQREIILKTLRNDPTRWFFSYELRGRQSPFGWIGHQGDRRARELAEDGLIVRDGEGKYAKYRATDPKGHYTVNLPDGVKTIPMW